MHNSATALRRWLGAFCLAVASGLLIWGQTVLEPHLHGVGFLIYWLVFLGFTCGAIGIGLLDFFAVRQELKAEREQLMASVLAEADPQSRVSRRDEGDKTPPHTDQG
jgi:hypothetical protein